MKKPAAPPRPPASVPSRDEVLAGIEEMMSRLAALQDRERDSDLRGAYRAAIDRLSALRYRLNEALARPRAAIGLPVQRTVPPPAAPEPPQRTLPLGPVPIVVKARKPKRR
jgi:hypothetical protein